MKNLIVVDFDKTLIPFDSFRLLIKKLLLPSKYTLPVIKYIFLRKAGIISSCVFKEHIYRLLYKDEEFFSSNLFRSYLSLLIKSINIKILNDIKRKTDKEVIVVLVSASPDFYIREIASYLGWDSTGSHIEEDKFVHLYGPQKVLQVLSRYPKSDYHYLFSISDSMSDISLLKHFDNHHILKKG